MPAILHVFSAVTRTFPVRSKAAIILSPEEYTRLTEIEEDYFLLLEATKRIGANGDKKVIPIDAVMTDLGISKEELMDTEDVDIE